MGGEETARRAHDGEEDGAEGWRVHFHRAPMCIRRRQALPKPTRNPPPARGRNRSRSRRDQLRSHGYDARRSWIPARGEIRARCGSDRLGP